MEKFVIKQDSWHWKLYQSAHSEVPKNFCSYFWLVVFTAFIWVCIFLLCSLIVASVISVPLFFMGSEILVQLAPLGAFIYTLILVFSIFYASKAVFFKVKSRKKPKVKKKPDGILVTKIKSFKKQGMPSG